jgi:hypothetical protein
VEGSGVKKLILLAALAAGVAYVVKFNSDQVKSAATKVTHDPRVQSALATASDKAGQLHRSSEEPLQTPDVPREAVEVAEADPVSAPEFTGGEFTASEPPKVDAADIEPAAEPAEPAVKGEGGEAERRKPDPLTDPLETLETPEGPTA